MNLAQSTQILFYSCLVAVVAATVGSALWAARDARKRNKSPFLVFLLVFFLQFPVGLIAWIVFRPAVPMSGSRSADAIDPDSALKRRANARQL
jgi:hypothetical protein